MLLIVVCMYVTSVALAVMVVCCTCEEQASLSIVYVPKVIHIPTNQDLSHHSLILYPHCTSKSTWCIEITDRYSKTRLRAAVVVAIAVEITH